jgi:hypothetical protein
LASGHSAREPALFDSSSTARLINGFISGILNAIVPVWTTESALHTGRDQFIAIEFTLKIFGVVVAYLVEN